MKAVRHEGDFAHSLTDLMSGVAVMFLVIAAIFMVQASQAKRNALEQKRRAEELAKRNAVDASKYKQIDQRDQQGIQEIEQLQGDLANNKTIELIYDKQKDPRLLTIVFNRETLHFAPGRCEVAGETRDALRQTLRAIFPMICTAAGKGLEKRITLEGHTDNQPPLGVECRGVEAASSCYRSGTDEKCKKEGFESNVQLSAARAQYVFFQAREVNQQDPIVANCLDRNFIVAGRGPMDPLDGGKWDHDRPPIENDKNRRVVIKVRVTPSVDEVPR